jgi:hypothetical protein
VQVCLVQVRVCTWCPRHGRAERPDPSRRCHTQAPKAAAGDRSNGAGGGGVAVVGAPELLHPNAVRAVAAIARPPPHRTLVADRGVFARGPALWLDELPQDLGGRVSSPRTDVEFSELWHATSCAKLPRHVVRFGRTNSASSRVQRSPVSMRYHRLVDRVDLRQSVERGPVVVSGGLGINVDG